jgi:hypothetical protein
VVPTRNRSDVEKAAANAATIRANAIRRERRGSASIVVLSIAISQIRAEGVGSWSKLRSVVAFRACWLSIRSAGVISNLLSRLTGRLRPCVRLGPESLIAAQGIPVIVVVAILRALRTTVVVVPLPFH